ncbi:hypothetical protein HY643_01415 [Candidatus Woesearchaeota archaeon]|nr:hypothetical protein [Candidatus Woesearchaeota archaeon]
MILTSNVFGLALSPPKINLGTIKSGESVEGQFLIINNLDKNVKLSVFADAYKNNFKISDASFSLKAKQKKAAKFILKAPEASGKYSLKIIVEEKGSSALINSYGVQIIFEVNETRPPIEDYASLNEKKDFNNAPFGLVQYSFFVLLLAVATLTIVVTTKKKRNV